VVDRPQIIVRFAGYSSELIDVLTTGRNPSVRNRGKQQRGSVGRFNPPRGFAALFASPLVPAINRNNRATDTFESRFVKNRFRPRIDDRFHDRSSPGIDAPYGNHAPPHGPRAFSGQNDHFLTGLYVLARLLIRPSSFLTQEFGNLGKRPRQKEPPGHGLLPLFCGGDQIKDSRSKIIHDQRNAARIGVDPVWLHVGLHGSGVAPRLQSGKKAGGEKCAELGGQIRIHRIKRLFVVRTIIARGLHADQQNRNLGRLRLGQNFFQIRLRDRRVDSTKNVVSAQRHDHSVHLWFQGPAHTRRTTGRCVPGNTGVDYLHLDALRIQPPVQLRDEPIILNKAVALSQRVSESGQDHRLGCGSNAAERQQPRRQSLAQIPDRSISQMIAPFG